MPTSTKNRLTPSVRRRGRRLRRLRAVWYHAAALVREFRGPILGFVGVTVVGGALYGEIYGLLRPDSPIEWIDRPYIMVQLMVLEAPEAVPHEWPLAVFWYLLPVAFLVIVASGAADFVNLFLNRDESRDPWGEALAMTYRHHIIVFGAGHVGRRVIRDLVQMGCDVVVVDQSPSENATSELNKLGVPIIQGDGRQESTLEKARLEEADAFIACTGNDQANMEAIMRVRHMHPDIRIVSRMWDQRFADQLEKFMNVDAVISSADLSAPAFAGAALGIEITQTIEVAGVAYSTICLNVSAGSFMEGATVGGLQKEHGMDIVLLSRRGNPDVNPGHDLVLAAGDAVVMFATHDTVLDLVSRNRKAG